MINVFEPDLGEMEVEATRQTISSKWIGKGKKEEAFRISFGKLIGVASESIVTFNSCTEAFFQLFEFLHLPQGSEVIVPTISFVGVANAVAANGLKINFCDVSVADGNPTLVDIQQAFNENTRAVIFQHYGGNTGEIEKIADFCESNNLILIEDAAAALGSSINGRFAGTFGDFGLWSFDAMKSISCGDGGALYVKNASTVNSLRIQAYLGLDFTSGLDRANLANDRWWNFEVKNLGRRSILNDLAASIGLVQLSRFEEKLEIRTRISKLYFDELALLQEVKVLIEQRQEVTGHSFYFLPIWANSSRDELAYFLKSNGVYTTFRYLPLHHQPIYGCTKELPVSDTFADHVLLLPMHTNLRDEDVRFICALVKDFYEK